MGGYKLYHTCNLLLSLADAYPEVFLGCGEDAFGNVPVPGDAAHIRHVLKLLLQLLAVVDRSALTIIHLHRDIAVTMGTGSRALTHMSQT